MSDAFPPSAGQGSGSGRLINSTRVSRVSQQEYALWLGQRVHLLAGGLREGCAGELLDDLLVALAGKVETPGVSVVARHLEHRSGFAGDGRGLDPLHEGGVF